MTAPPTVRAATREDRSAIAAIYNAALAERASTFETRPRTPEDIDAWLGKRHPVLVAEENGSVIAYASTSAYSPRECYAGIADFSIYVAPRARGRDVGRHLMEVLLKEAEAAGFHKLTSRVFATNVRSRALLGRLGFREVGVHEKHASLDGVWHDVVVVEKLLLANVR
ncbi:arsinothricin resistance N-acetyltransferase ArsN1 family A [Corallococcus carmarthensis]|uniref:N-acetyltransferase n=1 Tax=Corallococcus carmarthensis TaxID=2316728 RepID=A0A3A8K924_9BACT|nr:arsinothricin resistance N-acetyltransferase ArsN1 family A [Corallococcus carmarthensis]NOK16675.1 N-acetyltransferase [Corallococcus carmarthensis]RKH03699.1 N-acetyltransferase [Corallococcus carmarthensis]